MFQSDTLHGHAISRFCHYICVIFTQKAKTKLYLYCRGKKTETVSLVRYWWDRIANGGYYVFTSLVTKLTKIVKMKTKKKTWVLDVLY